MNVGDRVTTPAGPGAITRILTDKNWNYGKPRPVVWIIVLPDGREHPQLFPAADVELEQPTIEWP